MSQAASAHDILMQHWDGKLPVDPVRIARRMGVNVVWHQFNDDTVCETGLVGGQRTIRLAKDTQNPRARFAVAHALGHVVLHPHLLRELDAPPAPAAA